MANVKCPFCDGTGETAMGGVCAECAGVGTAKTENIDAIAEPRPQTPGHTTNRGVAEDEIAVHQYRVSIKSISDRPLAEQGGVLSHKVEFHLESADGLLSEDWDGGSVRGEDLKRCLQLKEKREVSVSEPKGWSSRRPDHWQEQLVNLALDHSVSESA